MESGQIGLVPNILSTLEGALYPVEAGVGRSGPPIEKAETNMTRS